MKKHNSLFLLTMVVFLLVFNTGCSNSTQNVSNIFSKGSTYQNDSFGIKIPIPDNWQIQNREDKNMRTAFIEDAKHNTVNLLTISKFNYDSDQPNPVFISLVEKCDSENGKDYLLNMKRLLENDDDKKYLVEKDIYTKQIDGVDFSVLKCKVKNPLNVDVYTYQIFYATVIKDYTYCFLSTAITREDLNILDEIVNAIKITK